MIEFFDRIFERHDQGDSLDIYLDFSKAFDKVPHRRFIKKVGGLWDSGECLKMDSKVARGCETPSAVKWAQIRLDRG